MIRGFGKCGALNIGRPHVRSPVSGRAFVERGLIAGLAKVLLRYADIGRWIIGLCSNGSTPKETRPPAQVFPSQFTKTSHSAVFFVSFRHCFRELWNC